MFPVEPTFDGFFKWFLPTPFMVKPPALQNVGLGYPGPPVRLIRPQILTLSGSLTRIGEGVSKGERRNMSAGSG